MVDFIREMVDFMHKGLPNDIYRCYIDPPIRVKDHESISQW